MVTIRLVLAWWIFGWCVACGVSAARAQPAPELNFELPPEPTADEGDPKLRGRTLGEILRSPLPDGMFQRMRRLRDGIGMRPLVDESARLPLLAGGLRNRLAQRLPEQQLAEEPAGFESTWADTGVEAELPQAVDVTHMLDAALQLELAADRLDRLGVYAESDRLRRLAEQLRAEARFDGPQISRNPDVPATGEPARR